mmetsp:Transcript_9465/g.19233  ORF Transcript_9465/g.19233 Transcript_9465/m.19233 type:complete len:102 (-) Transcript_9465:321-626(-)
MCASSLKKVFKRRRNLLKPSSGRIPISEDKVFTRERNSDSRLSLTPRGDIVVRMLFTRQVNMGAWDGVGGGIIVTERIVGVEEEELGERAWEVRISEHFLT